jgi:electron transport complex protein RnfG
MRRNLFCVILIASFPVVAAATPAGKGVPVDFARVLFTDEARVEEVTRALTGGEREALTLKGVRPPRRGLMWFRVLDESRLVGHLVGWQVRGKHGTIDLLVGVHLDATVAGVRVVRHRERWGAGISRKQFLGQFSGKGLTAPWQIGEDVDGISSATISSRAVMEGARDVLRFLVVLGQGEGGQ